MGTADWVTSADQKWRLRYSPRTLEASLPRELLDVVLWRFQQLGPKDRVTLETAAAVGVEFSAAQVAVAGDLETAAEARQRLAHLHERGFIARRGLGRVGAEDAVFRFLHPAHADVLAAHAPPVQQIRAAERIANAQRSGERFA